jgi:hypothetical protein
MLEISVSELLCLAGFTSHARTTVAETVTAVVNREKSKRLETLPTTERRQKIWDFVGKNNPLREKISTRTMKLLATVGDPLQALEIIDVANCLMELNSEPSTFFRRKLSGKWGDVEVHGTCEVQEDGTVIGRKTRGTRLWKRVWPSDSAKLHVHLWLTKGTIAQFIETCTPNVSTYKTGVAWNSERWRDIVQRLTPSLLKIQQELKSNKNI